MAQLMPLPLAVSCFRKIQIGFTFPVPADPRSPGKRTVKRVRESEVSPAFLLAEPSDEGDAVCRRIVDTAECTQRPFLLVAERLAGNIAIQRSRYAPTKTVVRRPAILQHRKTVSYTGCRHHHHHHYHHHRHY